MSQKSSKNFNMHYFTENAENPSSLKNMQKYAAQVAKYKCNSKSMFLFKKIWG